MSDQEDQKNVEVESEAVSDTTEDAAATSQDTPSNQDIEKLEEEKLKARYPKALIKPMSGHSAFLQKRLAKGQKFFDSGDYQMAKQKSSSAAAKTRVPQAMPAFSTGEAIPTPETVPVRKTSIIQQPNINFNTIHNQQHQ
ncbi:hypothetical protein B566_EDAN001853 [Ephemera danica]|nr:hypothetical protein B566_EDAN001853 [Ephemera danica]